MTATESVLGTTYRVSGDTPDLPAATLAIATDLAPRGVGLAADTTARDAKYAALITAGATGMHCYVTSRLCACVYTGATYGWRWLATPRLLSSDITPGYADYVAAADVKVIHSTGSLVLGGGKRLLQISAAVDWQGNAGLGSVGSANASISGSGISGGNMFTRIDTPGQEGQRSVSRQWFVEVSGTVAYTFTIIGNAFLVGAIDAYGTVLQVIDYGPAD